MSGTAASEAIRLERLVPAWRPLDLPVAPQLTDARLQLHHAAQLVAGFGASYVAPRADDGHTNMEWLGLSNALASNPADDASLRLAIRPRNLTVLALSGDDELACFTLETRTVDEAIGWVRRTVAQHGLNGDAFALPAHYTIPAHSVGEGRPFDGSRRVEFEQLDHWFTNAALVLGHVAATTPNASPVRCWPHHFDIATLIAVDATRTIGVGLEPGDQYYNEPYWYVNMHPAPDLDVERPSLDGAGRWHTREWIGAVLPASNIDPASAEAQSERFVASAMQAA